MQQIFSAEFSSYKSSNTTLFIQKSKPPLEEEIVELA